MKKLIILLLPVLQGCIHNADTNPARISMQAYPAPCDSNCFGYNEIRSMQCEIGDDSAVCVAYFKIDLDTAALNTISKDHQGMNCSWLLELDYKKDQYLDYVAGLKYSKSTDGSMPSLMPFENISPLFGPDVRVTNRQDGPFQTQTQLLNGSLHFNVRRANCIPLTSLFNESNFYLSTYTEEGSHGETMVFTLKNENK